MFVTDTPLSITSRLYPALPALMTRLNPPPFVGGPLRPGIIKRGLQRFRRAARVIFVSNSAMPVDKPVKKLPAPAGPNVRLQRFKRAARLVLVSNSAMPVDKSVEQLPAPSDSSFSSPVKPVRESNGENHDGESTDSCDSDANAESAQQGSHNTNQPKRA